MVAGVDGGEPLGVLVPGGDAATTVTASFIPPGQ